MNLTDITSFSDTEDLLVRTLKDAGYAGDLSAGSPIRQLLIDPNAILFQAQLSEQDNLRNSWKLLTNGFSTDVPYDMEVLYNLFNNLQVVPSTGVKATGKVQLAFINPDVRTVTPATEFISGSGEVFVPTATYTFVPSESYRSQYKETELVYQRTNSGYAVLIDVVAVAYAESTVANGSVFTTTLHGLSSAVAATSFVGGKRSDTLESLIKATPNTLSETSMASPISLTTVLYKQFPEITEMAIFRAGEPENIRASRTMMGVSAPCADVVVTTSTKPAVKRVRLQGHVELYYNPYDGLVYNGTKVLGPAYSTDRTEASIATLVESGVVVEGVVETDAGVINVIDGGIRAEDTEPTTAKPPESLPSPRVSVTQRYIITDGRYSSLPVTGSSATDFHNSSYQGGVKFELATKWGDINALDSNTYSHIQKWLLFWRLSAIESAKLDVDHSTLMETLASEDPFNVRIPQFPKLIRFEVPLYADILYYPDFAGVQSYISDPARRCFGQDYLIKAPHINFVDIAIVLSKDSDYIRAREDYFVSKIVDYINKKGLQHTGVITSDHIKSLIFEEVPYDSNETFNASFSVRAVLPDEKVYKTTGDVIRYAVNNEYGITERNSIFVCGVNSVSIRYN